MEGPVGGRPARPTLQTGPSSLQVGWGPVNPGGRGLPTGPRPRPALPAEPQQGNPVSEELFAGAGPPPGPERDANAHSGGSGPGPADAAPPAKVRTLRRARRAARRRRLRHGRAALQRSGLGAGTGRAVRAGRGPADGHRRYVKGRMGSARRWRAGGARPLSPGPARGAGHGHRLRAVCAGASPRLWAVRCGPRGPDRAEPPCARPGVSGRASPAPLEAAGRARAPPGVRGPARRGRRALNPVAAAASRETGASPRPRPCPSPDVSAGLLTVIPSGPRVQLGAEPRRMRAALPLIPPPSLFPSRPRLVLLVLVGHRLGKHLLSNYCIPSRILGTGASQTDLGSSFSWEYGNPQENPQTDF